MWLPFLCWRGGLSPDFVGSLRKDTFSIRADSPTPAMPATCMNNLIDTYMFLFSVMISMVHSEYWGSFHWNQGESKGLQDTNVNQTHLWNCLKSLNDNGPFLSQACGRLSPHSQQHAKRSHRLPWAPQVSHGLTSLGVQLPAVFLILPCSFLPFPQLQVL